MFLFHISSMSHSSFLSLSLFLTLVSLYLYWFYYSFFSLSFFVGTPPLKLFIILFLSPFMNPPNHSYSLFLPLVSLHLSLLNLLLLLLSIIPPLKLFINLFLSPFKSPPTLSHSLLWHVSRPHFPSTFGQNGFTSKWLTPPPSKHFVLSRRKGWTEDVNKSRKHIHKIYTDCSCKKGPRKATYDD